MPGVISLEGLVAKVYNNHRMEGTKPSRIIMLQLTESMELSCHVHISANAFGVLLHFEMFVIQNIYLNNVSANFLLNFVSDIEAFWAEC